ncbi:MAG: hypothetical protein LBF95_01015 [Treponema sp.]|jgi:hypothetical protein|nr:hypothetical protein [Treponema sp.]
MKNNRFFVLRMLALVLASGLVCGFASCAVFSSIAGATGVETDTSKMLLNTANDILLANSNMQVEAFKVAFERQLDGLALAIPMDAYPSTATITYENRKYVIEFNKGPQASGRTWTSARSCVDITKD